MSNEQKDAERYRFLRDQFALHSPDDTGEFAKLAVLTRTDFDKAIDKAMHEETTT